MTKVVIPDINSGYNLTQINVALQRIADELNGKVLYRDNPTGEPNSMDNLLDMNNFQIINLPAPSTLNSPARLRDVQSLVTNLAPASLIPFTPTASLSSVTVQSAIEEVDAKVESLGETGTGEGAALVGFSHATTYPQGTLGLALQGKINVKNAPYNAVGDGVADDTAAIQAALNDSDGRSVFLPAGIYRITSSLQYQPQAYTGAFGPGIHIYGDGVGITIIDNQTNGPALRLITTSTISLFRGALGANVEQMTITRSVSTSNGVGIFVTAAYNLQIRQVHIIGMSLHGIQIPCELGDNDGSNMLAMDHVRIENCPGWGIQMAGSPGKNEASFIRLQHVFIQACGTNSGSYQPTSGGISWKGQVLTLDQCAFTLNENCALWIPGDAGLGQTVDLQNTTFEHNKKRSLFCRGVSAFKARNVQFYNNNSFISNVGCEFDGADFVIRNVDIDGAVIRADNLNNPHIAFKLSGVNADITTCSVKNVTWDNYDYTGQTRFEGWLFPNIQQGRRRVPSLFEKTGSARKDIFPLAVHYPGPGGVELNISPLEAAKKLPAVIARNNDADLWVSPAGAGALDGTTRANAMPWATAWRTSTVGRKLLMIDSQTAAYAPLSLLSGTHAGAAISKWLYAVDGRVRFAADTSLGQPPGQTWVLESGNVYRTTLTSVDFDQPQAVLDLNVPNPRDGMPESIEKFGSVATLTSLGSTGSGWFFDNATDILYMTYFGADLTSSVNRNFQIIYSSKTVDSIGEISAEWLLGGTTVVLEGNFEFDGVWINNKEVNSVLPKFFAEGRITQLCATSYGIRNEGFIFTKGRRCYRSKYDGLNGYKSSMTSAVGMSIEADLVVIGAGDIGTKGNVGPHNNQGFSAHGAHNAMIFGALFEGNDGQGWGDICDNTHQSASWGVGVIVRDNYSDAGISNGIYMDGTAGGGTGGRSAWLDTCVSENDTRSLVAVGSITRVYNVQLLNRLAATGGSIINYLPSTP